MFPCIYELHPLLDNEPVEVYSHRGEKFIFVLSGILTVNLENHIHHLYPGDRLHIRAETPHNVQNNTSNNVKFLSVCVPDGQGDLVEL